LYISYLPAHRLQIGASGFKSVVTVFSNCFPFAAFSVTLVTFFASIPAGAGLQPVLCILLIICYLSMHRLQIGASGGFLYSIILPPTSIYFYYFSFVIKVKKIEIALFKPFHFIFTFVWFSVIFHYFGYQSIIKYF